MGGIKKSDDAVKATAAKKSTSKTTSKTTEKTTSTAKSATKTKEKAPVAYDEDSILHLEGLEHISGQQELDLVAECKERDVGFIAMKGLSGGLLNNAEVCHFQHFHVGRVYDTFI